MRQPSFKWTITNRGRGTPVNKYTLTFSMSHQIRPGARGGRDQFSWDQVKEDKQRLNYLGSSIHGVPDKFKKGPETFWYAKENKTIPDSKGNDEIEMVKNKEKQIMEALLGGYAKKTNVIKRNEVREERRQEHSRTDREHSRYRDHSHKNQDLRREEHSRTDREHSRYRDRSPRPRREYDDRHHYERHRSKDDKEHRHRRRSRSRSPRRNY